MTRFEHSDHDGDTITAYKVSEFNPYGYAVIVETTDEDRESYSAVGLTADAARDLAAKLTEWAGEPEPDAPTFAVGDRVAPSGHYAEWADAPARVLDPEHKAYGATFVRIERESDGVEGGFYAHNLRRIAEDPTPDYAALAAKFKPGDLAIVGDSPSLRAEADGYGVRVEDFAGKAVMVKGPGLTPGIVSVETADDHQYIHVAHLTKAKAVPA